MNNEKIIPILKGIIKHMPGIKSLIPMNTGGTNQSRYCYSVWHRHLNYWCAVNAHLPSTVAELGPGDSLGIGFAALLSGVGQVHFLDVVKYWDSRRNLAIFEELVELYRAKAAIPNDEEYPLVTPALENYSFPAHILTDEVLKKSLSETRLDLIRKEIQDIDNPNNSFIKYQIPWLSSDIVQPETLDFIYSQAVLEHVEDLDNTYTAMRKWLKPGGLMSHSIDFRSHGITPSWNGHWTFGDLEWQIVRGGKSFLINRQPYSTHLQLHSDYGFKILEDKPVVSENKFAKNQLAGGFRGLSDEDLTTSTTYILSKKDS